MTTVSISLPETMKAFVEEQAAREGYRTVSDYLRAVIRDVQKRQAAKGALEARLLEGARSPARRMTDRDWAEMERAVRQRSPELGRE